MKSITKLNGSDITANERETSERQFIRYYSQLENKPQRYDNLIINMNKIKNDHHRCFRIDIMN